MTTIVHTSARTTELWDAITHKLDLIDSLTATRDAWAYDGLHTDAMVDDASAAIRLELDKLAPLHDEYNALMGGR
jgi:hypothetical protein